MGRAVFPHSLEKHDLSLPGRAAWLLFARAGPGASSDLAIGVYSSDSSVGVLPPELAALLEKKKQNRNWDLFLLSCVAWKGFAWERCKQEAGIRFWEWGMESGGQCETWGEQIIPFASRKMK